MSELNANMTELLRKLKRLDPTPTSFQHTHHTLIVLSGDISDVDGFYGLAKYAQMDADVLFIMNYPAYLNMKDTGCPASPHYKEIMEGVTKLDPGKGYQYGTNDVITATLLNHASNPSFSKYTELLDNYSAAKAPYFSALTDLALFMAKRVWEEVENPRKGTLSFAVGGFNSINPFHVSAVKNELFVYAATARDNGFDSAAKLLSPVEGCVYDMHGGPVLDPVDDPHYDKIYLDFSGSMAFFNPDWYQKLTRSKNHLTACFVMGGVFTDAPALTMPAIACMLNRFSCATMNQFYHPENASRFFQFLKDFQISTFTVCNNVIPDLKTFDNDKKPTNDGWLGFLTGNNLLGPFLKKLATVYYNSPYGGPHKAFDYYTALALSTHARGDDVRGTQKQLVFNPVYAATLVGPGEGVTLQTAVQQYAGNINLTKDALDIPFIQAKKQNQAIELYVLSTLKSSVVLNVIDLSFNMDPTTKLLTLLRP